MSQLVTTQAKITDFHPDTPIYRIVDYFEAATTLQIRKLRFTKIAKFADDNEGIGDLLHSLLISKGPCKGAFGYGWKTSAEAVHHHRLSLSTSYASCWTREPESIAMWMLYSPLKLGVRLQTTIGKLTNLLQKYHAQEASRLRNTPIGSTWEGARRTVVTPIHYLDLRALHKRIDRFGRSYSRFLERRTRHGKPLPAVTEGGRDPYDRVKYIPRNPEIFSVKDIAYQHEQEIRGLIQGGRVLVESDIAKYFDKTDFSDELLTLCSETRSFANTDENLFIEIPDDFIVGICVDPRAPPHWATHMNATLASHGAKPQSSTAFGYIPLTHPFEIGRV